VSVVAVAVILGALVVLLLQTRQVKVGSAATCVVFGLVLGLTPAGPPVQSALDATGSWAWAQVSSL
jgi:hypothetical protein